MKAVVATAVMLGGIAWETYWTLNVVWLGAQGMVPFFAFTGGLLALSASTAYLSLSGLSADYPPQAMRERLTLGQPLRTPVLRPSKNGQSRALAIPPHSRSLRGR